MRASHDSSTKQAGSTPTTLTQPWLRLSPLLAGGRWRPMGLPISQELSSSFKYSVTTEVKGTTTTPQQAEACSKP